MSLFDSTTTIKFEPAYYEAMARNTAALTALVLAVTTAERNITMKIDEAFESLSTVQGEQAEAIATLTEGVAGLGESVDGLEQQIRDALGGTLTTEQETKVTGVLEGFRNNNAAILAAAAAAKAAKDDAGDGTGT